MKLNWLGRAALNSPLRAVAQAYVASRMRALGGTVEGGHVLEIGCGGGVGVSIILEQFGASEVEAIDIDPKMIHRARQRLATYSTDRVKLAVGNATSLTAKDATFDAVFDFGAIHLEPAWPKAIGEVARVLKPGGRFFFELVTIRALRLSYPLLTERFADMEPPSPESFLGELDHLGIVVGDTFVRRRLAALTGWVGDLIGVGWRSRPKTYEEPHAPNNSMEPLLGAPGKPQGRCSRPTLRKNAGGLPYGMRCDRPANCGGGLSRCILRAGRAAHLEAVGQRTQ